MNNQRKIIFHCHTCNYPIYEGERYHRSMTGSRSGTIETVLVLLKAHKEELLTMAKVELIQGLVIPRNEYNVTGV